MNKYREYLESFGFDVSPQWDDLCGRLEKKVYKKNEFVIKEGEEGANVFFFESGCMRYCITRNQELFTADLIVAPHAYAVVSALGEAPKSLIGIQALTELEVYVLSAEDNNYMCTTYEGYRQISEASMNAALSRRSLRSKEMMTMTPEQRYEQFVANNKELLKIVPQHIIASYLGIKPESLSRIRHRMVKNTTTKKG